MRLELEPKVTAFPLVENKVFEDDGFASHGDVESLLKKGIAAAQSGDRDQARKLLSQATAMDPASEDAWMWLASISEYPEELLAFLNRVLEINSENDRAIEWRSATNSLLAKTFVQRAIVAYEENALERADASLDQALSHDNDYDSAWFWKAKLAQSDDQKLEFLDRTLKLSPENPDALSAVAEIRHLRSQSAFNEAKAAAAAGNRQKAVEILDNFVKEVPDSVQAWLLKSHLAAGLEAKIEALENALAIDPDNTAARSGLEFLTLTFGSADDPNEPEACETVEVPQVPESVEFEAEEPPFVVRAENPVVDEPLPPVEPVVETSFNEVELYTSPEVASDHQDEVGETESNWEADHTLSAELQAFEPVQENEPDGDYRFEVEEALVRSAEDSFEPLAAQADAEFEDDEIPYGYGYQSSTVDVFAAQRDDMLAEEVVVDVVEDLSFAEPEIENVEAQFPTESSSFDSLEAEQDSGFACPFCMSPNEAAKLLNAQPVATLTLSDLEALLSPSQVDREVVQHAVTAMEAEWNLREFSEQELTYLGVGHLNLNNFNSGFKYLQEALRLNPNNVMLAGNLNTLAIRLDEMRRQSENYGAMPKGKKILVVDDSPTVRKLIAGKLEKSGHTVTCAVDGVDALDKFEDGMPDLVLLDITMPRMDGYEVCKQIRSNPAGKDIPIVMISGKDGFFDKVRGRMAGTTGYVTKPFGPETLMKALETYLVPENAEVN